MTKDHVRHRDAEQDTPGDHGAAGQGLKRIDGAQMAFAKKNAVVAELFGSFGAPMNFINILYAAVNAVQAEL
jgi:hypothetical protein